jgi:hypothetical protein
MTFNFTIDDSLLSKADDAANKLSEQGAYVGAFRKAVKRTAKSGSWGIELEFEAPGSGKANFTLWAFKEDNTPNNGPGAPLLQAAMYLMGLRTLEAESGMVEEYDAAQGKRVEKEGTVFSTLCNKPIGVVFEKELYTTEKGGTAERLNLVGIYQPETKLMVTELREKKTQPVKLDRLLKSLKVKDSRKKGAAASSEPSQPSLGADAEF